MTYRYQLYDNCREEAAALTATIGSLISMISVLYFIPKHVKHVKAEGVYYAVPNIDM